MLLKHFKAFQCPVLLISVYQWAGKKITLAGRDWNTNLDTRKSKLFSGENWWRQRKKQKCGKLVSYNHHPFEHIWMQGLHADCLCLQNESLDGERHLELRRITGQDNWSRTMCYVMAATILHLLSSRVERSCTTMHSFRDSWTAIVRAAQINKGLKNLP